MLYNKNTANIDGASGSDSKSNGGEYRIRTGDLLTASQAL